MTLISLAQHEQLRDKFPWYLFLLALLTFVLAWRIDNNGEQSAFVPGLFVFCTAVVRVFLALRIEDPRQARHAWMTGAVSLILAIVLIIARHLSPAFLDRAILVWIAISTVLVLRSGRSFPIWAFWGAFSLVAGSALVLDHQRWFISVILGIAVSEILSTAFLLTVVAWQPIQSVLLRVLEGSNRSELTAKLAASAAANEPVVRKVTNSWLFVIILVLLGIHLQRMGFAGQLGVLPPLIALVGDLIVAIILALVVIVPLRVLIVRLLGMHEHRLFGFMADIGSGSILARLAGFIFVRSVLLKIRLTEARFSLPLLLRQALIAGLPIVAVITAIVPLLGTNWFFDTEQWATIGRDEWAAHNAKYWRMKMVAAANPDPDRSLAVDIPGVETGDFSFVVVGDPGQGGLSQRELAKQIVRISEQQDLRFVLVSSDVVYPLGEMEDYEAKFWSPLSGLSKPILAIPGNHDWYDGLDAFSATFMTNNAARAAIGARTDDGRADRLLATAEKLKKRYGLATGWQTAPYFQVVSSDFALICVDTGVVAGIDDMQMEWLRRALADARGKTKMVLLGHPFFAWNRDRTVDNPGLGPILELLRRENVTIVMAGDHHDLEYYLDRSRPDHLMHHFVNGGGGAYISITRALGSPAPPILDQWAYYPTSGAIIEKLDAQVPSLIWPIWWGAKKWQGRVWSGDRFSTALDQDRSPFLNSFLVMQVKSSHKRIRVIPYGVHGRLKWSEFAVSADQKNPSQEYAEWLIPMSISR